MPSPGHNGVVGAIYRAGLEPESWPQALTQLAQHVGAQGALITYHAPSTGEDFMVAGGLRPDLSDLYLREYAHNPYSAAMMRAKPEVIYTAEQLADRNTVERTAFFADFLAPHGIRSLLVVGHPSLMRPGATGGIALPLNQRQTENIEAASRRLAMLVPHLMRGIEFSLQAGRNQAGPSHLELLLDAIPCAAVLLKRGGVVGVANRAAEALLAANDGLGIVRNGDGLRLAATNESERKSLASRIAQAVKCAAGDESELGGALRITRLSGRAPLIVLVIPLPPPAFSLYAAVDGGYRALVQIMDPQLPVDARAEHLGTAVGLTDAEKRVAALIGRGMSAPQTARALGLSLPTVKTHLAHCFDKSGVHSQTAFAHLVAGVSAATRVLMPTK